MRRTRLPEDIEAIAVRKIDLIRAAVPTNRRERQVIAELVRSGLREAFAAGRIDADSKTAADAWDEGERHESRYLDTWGQFCPGDNCNPYRRPA